MSEEVSTRNTKNEILDAYNRLKVEVRDLKKLSRQQQKEMEQQQQMMAAVEQHTPGSIQEKISILREEVNDELKKLAEQIGIEYEKYTSLQTATASQAKELEQTFGISREADSLDVLLLAHQREREAFETEMKEKREGFEAAVAQMQSEYKNKKNELDQSLKEEQELAKKQWKREQEEYQYQLQLERQKDQDAYASKKAGLEQELESQRVELEKQFAEREAKIKADEEELISLRNQVAAFPEELTNRVKETENRIQEQLTTQYTYQRELLEKEFEGERKLAKQTIASMGNKIAEHEALIQQLTERADYSNNQVQTIAVKAIESNASIKNFGMMRDHHSSATKETSDA